MRTTVNATDAEEPEGLRSAGSRHPRKAVREPTVGARWEGGSRSEVSYADRVPSHVGGDLRELSVSASPVADMLSCGVDLDLGFDVNAPSVATR